ncbi:hypothetical protein BDQ17DRAFT_1413770 [Cyathus striatus]|nr:hypothetical protein BDQ17DRAFT_1413770 [Cyathus striatus]
MVQQQPPFDHGRHVEAYNKLHSIAKAHQKLPSDKLSAILEKLYPIFSKHEYRDYGVCVLHSHFRLDGKKVMVTREKEGGQRSWIMRAEELNSSSKAPVADKWLSPGQEFEFRVSREEEDIHEPPPTLWDAFNKVLPKDVPLGICWLGKPLEGSKIYYESTIGQSEDHIIAIRDPTIDALAEPEGTRTFTTAWRAHTDVLKSTNDAIKMTIVTQCNHQGV